MAEPAVGKSRLFFEFKAISQSGWMVLETFSISHGKASAYLPVIDLLRNYFDITLADDERKRREKVNGKVLTSKTPFRTCSVCLASSRVTIRWRRWTGRSRSGARWRRSNVSTCESLNQPLMVIFEDLHWIDGETQELLNLLADSIGTAKFLLLVNYRPELFPSME